MTYTRIEIEGWRKHDKVAAIVRAAFPGYKRKKVSLLVCDRVTFHDLNWSGGTRSEYVATTLDGKAVGSMARYNAMWPGDNAAEGATIDIPPAHAVVRGGFFCGKESLLTLHIRTDDVAKVWPAQLEAK